MAVPELDPVFVRALRLLHSRSKESTSQLKTMLDDCLRQKVWTHAGVETQVTSSGQFQDTQKRNIEKLVRDLSELVPASKKPRLGSPGSKSHTPSPAPMSPSGSKSVLSGSSSSVGDFDTDLNLDSLNDCTCIICKSFNQESGNKLMECHSCQNLYHQECHEPRVSNEDAADPRLVWNCSECSKTIKKTLVPSKPSFVPGVKVPVAKIDPQSAALKRMDPKSTTSSGMMTKAGGMAALASSYKSGSNVRSGSSLATSSSTDKRLLMIKKKAVGTMMPRKPR